MESVRVDIFGQSYNIKGMADPEHIKELAAYLDAKMREIQKGTGTIEPHRVAILAALTICAELHELKADKGGIRAVAEQAVDRLLAITEEHAKK